MTNPPWDSLQLVSEPTILGTNSAAMSNEALSFAAMSDEPLVESVEDECQRLELLLQTCSTELNRRFEQFEARQSELETKLTETFERNRRNLYRIEQLLSMSETHSPPDPNSTQYYSSNPNRYGYEYYHGYSYPYSHQVCAYQVDYFNPGFYFVQFIDGSVVSMTASYLDGLLKSSYGYFENKTIEVEPLFVSTSGSMGDNRFILSRSEPDSSIRKLENWVEYLPKESEGENADKVFVESSITRGDSESSQVVPTSIPNSDIMKPSDEDEEQSKTLADQVFDKIPEKKAVMPHDAQSPLDGEAPLEIKGTDANASENKGCQVLDKCPPWDKVVLLIAMPGLGAEILEVHNISLAFSDCNKDQVVDKYPHEDKVTFPATLARLTGGVLTKAQSELKWKNFVSAELQLSELQNKSHGASEQAMREVLNEAEQLLEISHVSFNISLVSLKEVVARVKLKKKEIEEKMSFQSVVRRIYVVIEPVLIDQNYYACVEGREIISILGKRAGLAIMIDEYDRNTTARVLDKFSLGIHVMLHLFKEASQNKKSWYAHRTWIKIVQKISLIGCDVHPQLTSLMEAIEHGLNDGRSQKVRTTTTLSLVTIYGEYEEFLIVVVTALNIVIIQYVEHHLLLKNSLGILVIMEISIRILFTCGYGFGAHIFATITNLVAKNVSECNAQVQAIRREGHVVALSGKGTNFSLHEGGAELALGIQGTKSHKREFRYYDDFASVLTLQYYRSNKKLEFMVGAKRDLAKNTMQFMRNVQSMLMVGGLLSTSGAILFLVVLALTRLNKLCGHAKEYNKHEGNTLVFDPGKEAIDVNTLYNECIGVDMVKIIKAMPVFHIIFEFCVRRDWYEEIATVTIVYWLDKASVFTSDPCTGYALSRENAVTVQYLRSEEANRSTLYGLKRKKYSASSFEGVGYSQWSLYINGYQIDKYHVLVCMILASSQSSCCIRVASGRSCGSRIVSKMTKTTYTFAEAVLEVKASDKKLLDAGTNNKAIPALVISSLHYDFVKNEFWKYKLKNLHLDRKLEVPKIRKKCMVPFIFSKLWSIKLAQLSSISMFQIVNLEDKVAKGGWNVTD